MIARRTSTYLAQLEQDGQNPSYSAKMILLDALPMRTIAHDSYSSSRNYELTMKPRFLQLPYIKPSLVTSIQGFNATHAEDQKTELQ